MIICPACGKKNEDGEILCSDCGAKLKATERLQRGFAPKSTVAEPVKPLAEPVAKPAEPVIKPAEPVTKPADPVVKPVAAGSAVTPEHGNAPAGNWNEVKFNAAAHRKTPEFSLGIVFCAVIAVLFFAGAAKALAFSAAHRLTDIHIYSSYSYDSLMYSSQDSPEVYSSDGEIKAYSSGMKLRNGDRIVTGEFINASMNLGVDRTLKMMSSTETVVHQEKDETRIEMNEGAMFFNIDTPYSGREKLEIVSGDVVVPISEGAGYMFYNGNDHFSIWVMSGDVQVSAYDASGNVTTETMTPGETAYIYYSDDGVEFTVEKTGVDSLPPAMVGELAANGELMHAVSPDAGWDHDDIVKLAEEYKAREMQFNYGIYHYDWIMNRFFDD